MSKVGWDLYEKLFRGYTRKHWGADPSELHATVCGRIPVRFDADDRYFADSFQSMPADGYTAMFERMLDQNSIEVRLGTTYDPGRALVALAGTWSSPGPSTSSTGSGSADSPTEASASSTSRARRRTASSRSP